MSARPAAALRALAARMGPCAQDSFARATALAARLHADELSPEHWLVALLQDEDCAATRVVLHAFADPETIGIEVMALCSGTMVVGSERTLPFSVLGVEALLAARASAATSGAARVEPEQVFRAAHVHLSADVALRLAVLPGAGVADDPRPRSGEGGTVPATGPLFRHFSADALRALAAACRTAASLGRDAISPAHLVLGALEVDTGLRERTGWTPARTRMALSGMDADGTPLPERTIEGDARLKDLLAALPDGAETLEVLAWLLSKGGEETTALLRRQKVTAALLERCRGTFRDPPRAEGPPASP